MKPDGRVNGVMSQTVWMKVTSGSDMLTREKTAIAVEIATMNVQHN